VTRSTTGANVPTLSRRPDLRALATRLPDRPLTRFAPSPTGTLHLGHVVNAVYVWGLARALGGRVLLRFEDHDRARSRPVFERAILDDLEWLGLEPDLGLPSEFRAGRSPFRQSDADEAFARALAASVTTAVCTPAAARARTSQRSRAPSR
jgi:glutamyl/glutaminyl-tRNA synthetase